MLMAPQAHLKSTSLLLTASDYLIRPPHATVCFAFQRHDLFVVRAVSLPTPILPSLRESTTRFRVSTQAGINCPEGPGPDVVLRSALPNSHLLLLQQQSRSRAYFSTQYLVLNSAAFLSSRYEQLTNTCQPIRLGGMYVYVRRPL